MAQLPIYRQQGNITTQPPAQIRDLDTFAQGSASMQKTGNTLAELAARWQESKDAVENLDGRNKLNSGIAAILDEASNFNEYSTPEELAKKQDELTQRMNKLVPDIVSGFSNNQKAREFELNGQFATEQNTYKLQEIFRNKYGDMYNANLQITADTALRNFTKTGDESFKQEYFNAIDTGINAGYLDRAQGEKLKLGTNDWNYNYVYSQILEDPYFKASDEVMEKIDPVHQRTLRNFQRTEIKRAQAEAGRAAMNDYFLNPTDKNLRNYRKYYPDAKDSVDSVKNKPKNFNTETTYASMATALNDVKTLANIDTSKPEGIKKFTQMASKIGVQINNSNTLTDKDKSKLYNLIYKDMMNDDFKSKLKDMPNLTKEWNIEFSKDQKKLQADYLQAKKEFDKLYWKGGQENTPAYKKAQKKVEQTKKALNYYTGFKTGVTGNIFKNAPLSVGLKIEQLQKKAAQEMLGAYMAGNTKGAEQIKQNYGEQMIRYKYWNIPALQRKNLKVGDKFTVNGKVYSYQGFSKDDVIVEVH